MGRGKFLLASVFVLVVMMWSARADAVGARVRWLPSPASDVTGYNVYVRNAGQPYTAPPTDVVPVPAVDGTLSYTVEDLAAGARYFFAVTAHTADGSESGMAGEYLMGAVDPCAIDSCSAPTSCDIRPLADGASCDDGRFCDGHEQCLGGACHAGTPPECSDGGACTIDSCDDTLGRCVHVAQPDCCTVDNDCADTDLCTTAEHCVAGTCMSSPVVCPQPPCTQAFCDSAAGCQTIPVTDQATCTADELCGGGGTDDLAAKHMKIVADSNGTLLSIKGMFAAAGTVDPALNGMTVEIGDATATVLYRASLAGGLIRGHDRRFRYRAPPGSSGGIRTLVMNLKRGIWHVSLRAAAPELAAVLGPGQLGWALGVGDTCVRQGDLVCDTSTDVALCQ